MSCYGNSNSLLQSSEIWVEEYLPKPGKMKINGGNVRYHNGVRLHNQMIIEAKTLVWNVFCIKPNLCRCVFQGVCLAAPPNSTIPLSFLFWVLFPRVILFSATRAIPQVLSAAICLQPHKFNHRRREVSLHSYSPASSDMEGGERGGLTFNDSEDSSRVIDNS